MLTDGTTLKRIEKLPKWARDEIWRLKSNLDRAHKKWEELSNEYADIITDPFTKDTNIGFDRHTVVRYRLGTHQHIDIHHKGDRIEVFGNWGVEIIPRASNTIWIKVED